MCGAFLKARGGDSGPGLCLSPPPLVSVLPPSGQPKHASLSYAVSRCGRAPEPWGDAQGEGADWTPGLPAFHSCPFAVQVSPGESDRLWPEP